MSSLKDLYTDYTVASSQGVVAIVWDDILQAIDEGQIPLEQQPTKAEKIRWVLAVENIIKQYHRRKALSIEIADIWAQEGIKTYGLKGWALSTYYPKPELRECGDFDCYLGADFARGNEIAIANGAQFDPHDYRHSHIYYKGLTIENHRYFLPIRGNDRNKRLEQYLQAVIPSEKRIENSNVYYPSPQFHALFIILHMLQHFLHENITLRHMLDWTYFVNAEKENIDWREFNAKCDEAGATRFIEALNHICTQHMGLDLNSTLLKADSRYADKILKDNLEQSSRHVSGVSWLWRTRYMKVRNIIEQRWKFNEVYDRNFVQHMLQTAIGIACDRNVRL
ncbi:MAG: nucleotidyltransferase family protein [Alistipes sp.]|nr:nucleotidyltransferase family protein [Alistipes sp.]